MTKKLSRSQFGLHGTRFWVELDELDMNPVKIDGDYGPMDEMWISLNCVNPTNFGVGHL